MALLGIVQPNSLKKQFAEIVFAIVSLVVALAWNSFFTKWIGDRNKSTNFTLLYAFLATVAGVVIVTVAYSFVDKKGAFQG
jgi:RsiW-degrading membrane proteinase PrsW (M82 family)